MAPSFHPRRFMLRSIRLPGLLVGLVTAATLAGCASTAKYPVPPARTILVVNNANTALNAMEVHLLTPTGVRLPLGTVGLNESRSFQILRNLKPGSYRLEGRGFEKVLSHGFRLDEGDVVEWDLSRNAVLFQGKAAGRSGASSF